jgi:4-hydroxybenzoyl-CoA reductase beta subunit
MPDTMLIGGGSDIIPKWKRKQLIPSALVFVDGIKELATINFDGKSLSIGSGVKIQNLIEYDILDKFRAIKTAASSIATLAIRNIGTVGGNIFQDTRCIYTDKSELWRDGYGRCLKYGGSKCFVARGSSKCVANYQSDLAPAFLIYNAKLYFASYMGDRAISFENVLKNDGKNHIQKMREELLIKVEIPYISNFYTYYIKLSPRDSFDFPELGVALGVKCEEGKIVESRIALTGLASFAYRVTGAEQLLNEKPLSIEEYEKKLEQIQFSNSSATFSVGGSNCSTEFSSSQNTCYSVKIDCVSATFYSTAYKIKITKILLKRLFERIKKVVR